MAANAPYMTISIPDEGVSRELVQSLIAVDLGHVDSLVSVPGGDLGVTRRAQRWRYSVKPTGEGRGPATQAA
jgi:hypothetical protein